MVTAQQLLHVVRRFVSGQIELEELEDYSASFVHVVHRDGDAIAAKLAHKVQSILFAFEDDECEAGMRRELANAIRPFEEGPAPSSLFHVVKTGASIGIFDQEGKPFRPIPYRPTQDECLQEDEQHQSSNAERFAHLSAVQANNVPRWPQVSRLGH
jgi:hypothetical protein